MLRTLTDPTTHTDLDVSRRLQALGDEQARFELLGWMSASHERAHEEDGHGTRVAELSGEIASATGLPTGAARHIADAARVHDIGKLGVPDTLLRQRHELSHDDLETIKTHTTIGAEILAGAGTSPVFQLAAVVALTHHERWDGSGYHGLRDRQVPLAARIVGVADVYDALTNTRCYKRAWSSHEATEEIVRGAGVRFAPDIVDGFLAVVGSSMRVRTA